MSRPILSTLIHHFVTANVCALAVVLATAVGPVQAGQAGAQFNVAVKLQSNVPRSNGLCRTSSFGAIVTIVCSTGAVVDISPGRSGMPWSPMHGGAYRFATEVERVDNTFRISDSDTGTGTTTSWRIVNLANREYLEMTVAW
jgi:hypothetical protein